MILALAGKVHGIPLPTARVVFIACQQKIICALDQAPVIAAGFQLSAKHSVRGQPQAVIKFKLLLFENPRSSLTKGAVVQ